LDGPPERCYGFNRRNDIMMEAHLRERLKRVIARRQWYVASWYVAGCWALVAVLGAGFYLVARQTAWSSALTLPLLGCGGLIASVWLLYRSIEAKPDFRSIALHIERRHPDLKGLLITAVQQELPQGKTPNYLQYRVLQQALELSNLQDWRDVVPKSRFWLAQGVNVVAFALAMLVLPKLYVGPSSIIAPPAAPLWGVSVDPGDTQLEKGETLVVLARFGGQLPTGVDLVVRTSGQTPRQITLVKNLSDPVFSGSLPEVAQDLTYHLEYAGRSTPEYKVQVFEHPRLERADVVFKFPAYTGLPDKAQPNTRRVSAVEGTLLDWTFNLNKPVKSAQLVSRDASKTVIPLEITAGQAIARLPQFALTASQSYDLQLVDADGRASKPSQPLVFDALPNRPPEIKLTTPRGDVKPSAVEEVAFAGTVLDDFGSPAYGIGYQVVGGEEKTIELGKDVASREKRAFSHLLALEEVGVKPQDLVSWYVWADDIGPDGNLRRTTTDLFFGEIRPFDQIFRENQQPQQQPPPGGGGQPQQQRQRLIELQKQIITATFNIQRNSRTPARAGVSKAPASK
jgi:hypothetical protein